VFAGSFLASVLAWFLLASILERRLHLGNLFAVHPQPAAHRVVCIHLHTAQGVSVVLFLFCALAQTHDKAHMQSTVLL